MRSRHALLPTIICALGLFLLALPPVGGTAPVPTQPTGTVSWIYDADTLKIEPHGKVRLLGVDAPEKTPSSRDDKFLAMGIAPAQLRAAHRSGLAWCIDQVKGKQVGLSFDSTLRDRYGRLLAYVHLPDGRLLNQVLLEEGLVIVYRRFPFRLKADFLAAEALARESGIGLWSRPPAVDAPAKKE
jgi:micrococcal nuclease